LFYKYQVTQILAITPDVQLITNLALNPDGDVIAIYGLPLRIVF